MRADPCDALKARRSWICRALLALLPLPALPLLSCAERPQYVEPYRIADRAHGGGSALDIAPAGNLSASGGWEGHVRLWTLPDGKAARAWSAHEGQVTGLMFLADGRGLISAGWDGRVRLWDPHGKPLADWSTGIPISGFFGAPDGSSFLLGHTDGTVQWRSASGDMLDTRKLSDAPIAALVMDGETRHFAAADVRGGVWRWGRGEQAERLARPPTYARSLLFDPRDGDLLGSGWFLIFRWPRGENGLQRIPTDHHGIINHLEFDPTRRYLASISRQTDSRVLLLDPDDGRTLRAFAPHALCGQRVSISPDGRTLMSNSDDASVRFYHLTTIPPVSARPDGNDPIHQDARPR